MSQTFVSQANQNVQVNNKAFNVARALQVDGRDFRSMLYQMYNKANTFLKDYADPNVESMTLDGFGTFEDKNAPGFQIAASFYLNDVQTQLTTVLSHKTFVMQTLPTALERMIG